MALENITFDQIDEILDLTDDMQETGEFKLRGQDLYYRKAENVDWRFLGNISEEQDPLDILEYLNEYLVDEIPAVVD